jgi:hypothetical protein
VKYWRHEIKWHRSDLRDWPSSGRPLLEHIDARILQVLEAEPWFSVRTIAEFLEIPVSMVHLRLTNFFNMKSRYFKWIPLFLDDLMMIYEQNDWRVPDSFSTSCMHKRDVIFDI